MWASPVKSKILQKHQFWRIFFIFVANGNHFQKCQFLIEILSFLKEISSVFENVNLWWLFFFFFFSKKYFYAKIASFWANESISNSSDKIMSCKLWGKITSVSVNINFGAKMSFLCEKNWNFGKNVDFFIKCALLLALFSFSRNNILCKKRQFLDKWVNFQVQW